MYGLIRKSQSLHPEVFLHLLNCTSLSKVKILHSKNEATQDQIISMLLGTPREN